MIRRARTDSNRRITYDPAGRPAVAGLLELLAAVTGEEPNRLADQIGDRGGEELKHTLGGAINELLAPIRRRRAELGDDESYLDDVLDTGNARAREIADKTLTEVHKPSA
jgi:tryptophanyl-tRNA synthetase